LVHADSWGPWVDRFHQAGYEPTAPGCPGDADTVEETRQHPERVADAITPSNAGEALSAS